MTFFDILLLIATVIVAGGAVFWACRELGGVVEWFVDGSDELRPALSDADLVAAREELLRR